jgi:hypothetical protein
VAKHAALAGAMAEALGLRDVPGPAAGLAAELGARASCRPSSSGRIRLAGDR